MASLTSIAYRLFTAMQSDGERLVLAESCTAGLIAAQIAGIPGASQILCGSFVVYRSDSKRTWLGIPDGLLEDPDQGPVSSLVTRLLAQSALEHTPEATVGVAVTGHLGPGVASHLDGHVFACLLRRGMPGRMREHAWVLQSASPTSNADVRARKGRQREACRRVLCALLELVQPEK
jgi:PncC family amidohydrolase